MGKSAGAKRIYRREANGEGWKIFHYGGMVRHRGKGLNLRQLGLWNHRAPTDR
jgi:hypothetical protein